MKSLLALGLVLLTCSVSLAAPPPPLAPPPQDQGLPYTRSSIPEALKVIRGGVAVFPGSRYGYVLGARVRLSDAHLRGGEACEKGGELWVPASFIRLLDLKSVQIPAVPPGLEAIADRWVYSASDLLPQTGGGSASEEPWVSFQAAAAERGLKISTHSSGLVVAAPETVSFPDGARAEALVTLFDTPEKFADPDIATRNIPMLARQGKWTEHIRVTPEQIARLNGPEEPSVGVPDAEFDPQGINTSLFGSKPPAPGVYPRILFNAEDIPALAARVKSTTAGQMSLLEMEHLFSQSWWDPSTSDGQVFEKLSSGNLEGLEWDRPPGKPLTDVPQVFKGQKPGIYNSHVAYVPECLTAMALYALLTNDDALGKKTATAIANYYKLREPLLDEWLRISDSEFGSSLALPDGTLVPLNAVGATTHWRNIHGLVAHMNLGLSLDFSGRWMSPAQIDDMRRFIAKATYGRRSYAQDGPVRFRDVNWMAWDLTHFLAVAAIEGLPGFDPEAFEAGAESVRAFCDWGVDPNGVVYESNGKNPGAFEFQLLSMVTVARRAENLFAHPHWRRLLEGQVQMTSPSGRVIVNSGTQYVPHSRQHISLPLVTQLKSFYPGSRLADYLVTAAVAAQNLGDEKQYVPPEGFDPDAYRAQLKNQKRMRLPSITYPGFVRAVLYDSDIVPTTRAELKLPLDFDAPVHGVFSAYSDASPQAAWMNLMVRPDHYLGGGHHHADSGMFHFSALGVDWITESPFTQWYTGNAHNLVLVDGKSEADGFIGIVDNVINGYNAAGTYLGAAIQPEASAASADLTYAYSWRWNTQPPQVWTDDLIGLGWEMDPTPHIQKIFAGTARYKIRPWWPNSNYSNYIATSRAPFNPMQYVFRTTGLVRGKHSYGFVLDDLKKDETARLYQWTAMLNGGVWRADVPGLPPEMIALAYAGKDTDILSSASKPALTPQPGDPILLVCAPGLKAPEGQPLFSVETAEGPKSKKGEAQFYDRLLINQRGTSAGFRVFLLPVRYGDPLPKVTVEKQKVRVAWEGQTDEFDFSTGDDHRTSFKLQRGGKVLLP